jgi:hypothetical protein
MTRAEDLEGRAGLLMINPAPYNAEALPGALDGDITPTELHYVRSNFALPAHDGTLEIGGAVATPRPSPSMTCARCRHEMRPLPTSEP